MKLALTSIAAVTAALVAVAPASASTFVLNGGAAITPPASFSPTQCFQNSVGAGTSACELQDNVAVGSSYTSLYEFSLANAMTMSASIFTNTLSGITFNSVTLYSNGMGAYGTTGATTAYTLIPGAVISMALNGQVLAAGNYTVAVNATVNRATTTVASNFGFTNVAAAAPEPATWGLMVLGFGAVGGALRTSRRKVAFA